MPSAPGTIDPRPDRAEAGGSLSVAAGGGGGTAPRSRIWSFLIETPMNQRSTIVSPPFIAPAMIYEIVWRWVGAANNIGGPSFFWANENGGAVTGGAPTIIPSGNRVLETASVVAATVTETEEVPEHFVQIAPGGDIAIPVLIRPKFIVPTTDRWFLKVSLRGGTAGGAHVRGVVTIVEAATLAELLNF